MALIIFLDVKPESSAFVCLAPLSACLGSALGAGHLPIFAYRSITQELTEGHSFRRLFETAFCRVDSPYGNQVSVRKSRVNILTMDSGLMLSTLLVNAGYLILSVQQLGSSDRLIL